MHTTNRRTGTLLVVFGVSLLLIVMLAYSSTSWAAPNAQGTVPTPPGATAVATDTSGGGGGGGGGGSGGDTSNTDTSNNSAAATLTPAAAGAGVVCAIGDAGAQCSASDLIVQVAAGAASPGSALTIEGSFPQPPCPPSPSGHKFLNRCYRYAWIGTNAESLNAIQAPVQYCISFGAEQLAAVANKPEQLLVGVAGADGTWSLLKPTVDAAGNRTCATTNQLIVWSGLFAAENASAILPTVGGVQSNFVWLALLGIGGALLALGAWQLRRQ